MRTTRATPPVNPLTIHLTATMIQLTVTKTLLTIATTIQLMMKIQPQ